MWSWTDKGNLTSEGDAQREDEKRGEAVEPEKRQGERERLL
jgi:hypothetical protein